MPRFTLRGVFVLSIVAAMFFMLLSSSLRGSPWAIGLIFGLGSVAAAFAAYAFVFGLAWYFVELRAARHAVVPTSPFADDTPPEQVVPPTE